MQITVRGHNFFEIKTQGKTLVIDPFTDNGMTETKPSEIDADLVLITHGHGDHVGCVAQLDAPVVAIYEIAQWLERMGRKNITGMNIGGTYRFGDISIHMTQAVHSSGLPTAGDTLGNGGSPAGFLIDDGTTKFYIMGDTGLFGDMKTVIRDILKPDIAAVPIGDLFTMGPEHAAIATEWIGASHIIPCHYNTFPPIEQDPRVFAQRVGDKANVIVMQADDTIEVKGRKLEAATVTA